MIAFCFLSGWAPTRQQTSLFTLVAGSAPFELRYTLKNHLRLMWASESNFPAELPSPMFPVRPIVSALAGQAISLLSASTGDRPSDSADLSDVASWRLLRGNDTARNWDGHL